MSKKPLELHPTNQLDDWGRPIYKDDQGNVYVNISLGEGIIDIHDTTEFGEPVSRIDKFIIKF